MLTVKRCPQRHLLSPGASSAKLKVFHCDVCGKQVFDKDVVLSCGRCMFDACRGCVDKYPTDFAFRARLANLNAAGIPLLPVYERMPHTANVLFRDVAMAAVFWTYQEWANTDDFRRMLQKEADRLDGLAQDSNLLAREARLKYVFAQSEADAENSDIVQRCAL